MPSAVRDAGQIAVGHRNPGSEEAVLHQVTTYDETTG
jgi:hypothetical protein